MSEKDDLNKKYSELTDELVKGYQGYPFPVRSFFANLDLRKQSNNRILKLLVDGLGEPALRRAQVVAMKLPEDSNAESVMRELCKHWIKCAVGQTIKGQVDAQITQALSSRFGSYRHPGGSGPTGP